MVAPNRSAQPTDSRVVAFEVLRAVLNDGRPLDEALSAHRGFARLASRDRGFARLLATTTLRRLGQIDDLVSHCLEKSLRRGLGDVQLLLRLGACQLALLRTPPHAAIDATVALAGAPRLEPYRSLVNAVLRRLSREMEALMAEQDVARLCTPSWLWVSWVRAYGEQTTRAIAEAQLEEPPLDLTPGDDADLWAGRLGARVLPCGQLRLPSGAGEVTKLAGFKRGAWWVQDLAASLPARLLGPVSGQGVRDQWVVDLCAAPGGKTAQLASAGARVTAIDRSEARLKLVAENLARLELKAELIAGDARTWKPATSSEARSAGGELPDAVLLDAPCSGTGTLRRHPDIAILKSERDVASLARSQEALLKAAAAMVKPGGLLVYAVCSLQPEEGPRRIAQLLEKPPLPLERVPVKAAEIGGLSEAITPEGDLRTLPCHLAQEGGMDGFYACRLRRKAT